MKRLHPVRLALWLAGSLAGGDAGFAQSVEASAPGPERPALNSSVPEGSIDGARKDFDAVRSLRELGVDSKGETPRVSVPTMQNGPAPSPLLPAPKKQNTERQSSNWLVDAMEKRVPPRDVRGHEGRLPQAEAEKPGGHDDRRPIFGAEGNRKDRGGESVNPFARYLGEWITPQDYALLKPALMPSSSPEALLAKAPTGNTPGEAILPGLEDSFRPMTAVRNQARPVNVASTPRENPYLETVGSTGPMPSPSPVPAKSADSTKIGALPGAIAPTSQEPAAVPRSPLPEFMRPKPDEKYFKQLKRF